MAKCKRIFHQTSQRNRTKLAEMILPQSTLSKDSPMNITLKINDIDHSIDTAPSTTLFAALRGLGFHGVKFGDEGGLSGSDTILLDGKPVNAGSLLAAQAEGHDIATIEALGEHPERGWKLTD